MGISGLIGAGAQDALAEILQRQLLERQQAEVERARQEGEKIQRERLDLDRAGMAQRGQIADREQALRERALDEESRGVWESTARKDRADMEARITQANNDTLADEELAALPADAPARAIVNIARATGAKPNLQGEDVLSAGAVDQRKRDDITFRTNEQIRATRAAQQAQQEFTPPPAPKPRPTPTLSDVRGLRNDFMRETTAAREVASQARMMGEGLAAARRGDMAAGSQAVLVTFQKILDPTSVVRESEYARSAAGQAALAQIQGAYERVQQGGAGVPVQELEKFAQMANQILQARAQEAAASRDQINAIAQEYGINPELVTRDIGGTDAAVAPPQTPAGASGKFKILGVK